MNARRLRRLFFSGAGLALVLCAAASLNVVSHFLYARLDLSDGKVYSISTGTKAVLSRLQDALVIRAYFTPHLPPPYGIHEQYLRDLLGEYRASGRGRVRVEFLDPDSDERIKRQAQEAGVAPVQLNMMSRDKFEAKEAYMGVVFLYKGKTEVLPLVQDVEGLELALTRHVKRLVDPARKSVGFVSGHGEKTPDDPNLAEIFALVREQMDVAAVSLDKPLPAKLDALWVVAPSSKYKPAELDVLRNWVAGGKSLGLYVGRRAVGLQAFRSAAVQTGLEDLLKSWGLEERDGFIVDAQCERIAVPSQFGAVLLDYPHLPIVKDFDRKNPATRALGAVTFPYAHPLVFRAQAASGARWTPLARSSRLSWYQASNDLTPGQDIEKLQTSEKGPFTLAGVLEAGKGKVIVVGTRSVLDPRLIRRASDLALFMNLLDWSFQDEDLLSIRAKGVSFRPLRRLSDGERAVVKYWLILFLPFTLLLAGLVSYRRLRTRAAELRRLYVDEAGPADGDRAHA